MKKEQKNFLKVGIFLASLLIVLMIMILSIGKETAIFARKVELRGRVANVSNLKPGSFVELKGLRIGTVREISIVSAEEVEIRFMVLRDQLQWIRKDSSISIATAGLVGDRYLEVTAGSQDEPEIDPENDLLYAVEGMGLQAIMDKGENIATSTEQILERIDRFIAGMGDGRKIAQILNSLEKSSANLEKITGDLRQAGLKDTVSNVNASMARLSKASVSLEKVMGRVQEGPGTLNSLIYDDSLHESLRALLGGAQRNRVIKYFIRQSIQESERKKPEAQ
jgi:phospholipid/cholesterol/gamma-HCH transport system substrate-binding protein